MIFTQGLLTKREVNMAGLVIGVILVCEFMDLDSVSVFKHAKTE